VIFRLQKLKFLDCHKITDKERDDVSKESFFYDVVSFKESDDAEGKSLKVKDYSDLKYTPLTGSSIDKNNNDPKGRVLSLRLKHMFLTIIWIYVFRHIWFCQIFILRQTIGRQSIY
jgi:hypothetical protein